MRNAVAVKYSKELPAPIIIAKGKDELAKKITELAKKFNIDIIRNDELAESLIELNIGDFIPEEFYEIMAQIIIFVKKLDKES